MALTLSSSIKNSLRLPFSFSKNDPGFTILRKTIFSFSLDLLSLSLKDHFSFLIGHLPFNVARKMWKRFQPGNSHYTLVDFYSAVTVILSIYSSLYQFGLQTLAYVRAKYWNKLILHICNNYYLC